MAQKVPLLYLANDILQNSKRKGNEFVTVFWKVLPVALKDLNGGGDDQGKKVVSRLVKIWEERRVFGSRAQNLKDAMLADEAPPPLEFSKKRSRLVKIVRRDSRSIRTKLSIGGSAERIVSALHSVLSDQSTEDSEMNRCKSAVNRVRKMEHDVNIACAQVKDPKRKTLAKELEEEENIMKECMDKLKSVEANSVALVTQLREALQEQESELENIRTQMQVAQAQTEEADNMRKRLSNENYTAATSTHGNATNAEQISKKTAADIAAEVADKLAASSASQFIMSSVLSTFAAQGANNAAHNTPAASNSYRAPDTTLQSPSPSTQSPYQLLTNTNTTTTQQYVEMSRGVSAYGYGSLPPLPSGQPPSPPSPPHVVGPMMPLAQPRLQMKQQSMLLMQPQPAPPNFRPFQPPGMLYFTQSIHLH